MFAPEPREWWFWLKGIGTRISHISADQEPEIGCKAWYRFLMDLAARLGEARRRTDELFALLHPSALYDRPIPERHRIIFYLGHLEAFDWNLVCRDTLGERSFHPEFDRLFAFGIDPVEGNLPSDKPADWPSVDQIGDYNRRIRERIDAVTSHPAAAWMLNVAIEHRLMHAETFAYMLHWLPCHLKRAPSHPAPHRPFHAERRMIGIPAGKATLGLARREQPTLGWDNEYERHTIEVPSFAIQSHNVTNGDYLEFVRAGGYNECRVWEPAAWQWIRTEGLEHPRFWSGRDPGWRYVGMFGEVDLPLEAPVYVSHAEASAYARWKRMSLPTEPQFHRAAYGTPSGAEREYPWGNDPPDPENGNFDFSRWDPVAAGAYPAGNSAFGVSDLVGNGWEWTSTIFGPFAGFEPLPFYPTYSAGFFDGKHFVMKGGSHRTAAVLLRRSFRNWFQPHYPYIYASFRLVE
jgi:gamma-glutamyl hercynylcysteine S-oxide synthase